MTDGSVALVGAGPGDPELLTVKARRLLADADVILYDSLVGEGVHGVFGDDTTVVDVGKKPGDGDSTSQAAINDRLVGEARRGKDVVRLKGGDPFVFGRGGEEIEHLAAAGVPFEVVPGISSAIGVPGAVGIPLTHRDHASSFAVVTGHEDPTKEESALDWSALADTVVGGGTLVILMGVGRLPDNVDALGEHGVPGETPVAMIERGTCEGERAIQGTLSTIVDRSRDAEIEPPATTVVGNVVGVGSSPSGHPRDSRTAVSGRGEGENLSVPSHSDDD